MIEREVLARSIDGVYEELMGRQARLNYMLYTSKSKYHYRTTASRLKLYSSAVELMREIKKLRAIIFDLTYILHYTNHSTMSTTVTTERALTKQELYEQIGECNILIVKTEKEIIEMEEVLNSSTIRAEHAIALRESLHESRMYLDGLNQTARTNRLIIISRIEIEVEEISKQARDCRNADQTTLIATLNDLNKELERLRKIVYPCTNN